MRGATSGSPRVNSTNYSGPARAAIAALGGRVPLDGSCPAALAGLFVQLGGLGVEFRSHQPQSLGTGEIEAASRDTEAVVGLATQELRGQHDLHDEEAEKGGRVWPVVLNAGIGCWFRELVRLCG